MSPQREPSITAARDDVQQQQAPGLRIGRLIDRRTFLKGMAVGGLAMLLPPSVWAQLNEPAPASGVTVALDPIERLVRDLEFDPDRIIRFVGEEIRYEPYAGILRGADGVLQGRAGNSADQSLLLAALLGAAGVPVRFVTGSVDDADAATLVTAAALGQDEARARAAFLMHADGRHLADPERMAVDPTPEVAEDVAARGSRTRVRADAMIDDAIETISAALATADISLARAASEMPDLERQRHVWVQMASGADWTDVDPTFHDSPPARSTPASSEPTSSLPDELRHRVRFRVDLERISGGSLERRTILDHETYADEIAGKPAWLLFDKPEGLKAIGGSIQGTLEGTVQYLAVLSVGGLYVTSDEPITLAGGGGIDSAFETGSDHDGEATAVWLEVDVVPPSGETRTARRTMFDRVADLRRDDGVDVSTIPPVRLDSIGSEFADEYLPLRRIHFMGISTGSTSDEPALRLLLDEDRTEALMSAALLYHLCRDALAMDLALARGVEIFVDGPTIATLTLSPVTTQDGRFEPMVIDLLHRSFGTLAVTDTPISESPTLVAGVLSHVAERVTAGETLPAGEGDQRLALGVGSIFELARDQGIGTRLMRPGGPLADLPSEPLVRRRLLESLEAGWSIVIPERSVDVEGQERLGWWLVDELSGRVVDELDDGRGGVLGEAGVKLEAVISWLNKHPYLVVAICLAQIDGAAAMVLTAALGSDVGSAVADGVSEALKSTGVCP